MFGHICEEVAFLRCWAVNRESKWYTSYDIKACQHGFRITLNLASFLTYTDAVPLVKPLPSNHRGSEGRGRKLKQNFRNKLLYTVFSQLWQNWKYSLMVQYLWKLERDISLWRNETLPFKASKASVSTFDGLWNISSKTCNCLGTKICTHSNSG